MDTDAARHFEDPGDTELVFVQRGFERTAIHRTVLDLRCEEAYRLGPLRETCGREYVADLPAARFIRRPSWPLL